MKYRHTLIVGLIFGLAVVAFGSHPYISNYGTLIDDFEDVSEWTVSGTGASAANDTSIFTHGTQSIKLNATEGIADLDKSVSLDFSSGDGFSLWVYIVDKSKFWGLILRLTSTSDWSKYFYIDFNLDPINGWNYQVFSKSQFGNVNNESWDNTMIKMRLRINPWPGTNPSAYFDDLRFGIVGQPKVIMSFDDNHESQFTEAYPILANNNQRGVVFINPAYIGSKEQMTLSNLQTLQAAGWDISNHTYRHRFLTQVSQEKMEEDIDDGYDWLVANGFGDTAKFFCYPGSQYNDAIIEKVKERHVLARASQWEYHGGHFDIIDFEDLQYKLSSFGFRASTPLADIQTEIDRVIERGGLLHLYTHAIDDANHFKAISDYLKAKQDAGLLEVITFSDYYNALIKWHRLEPEPSCPEMDFNGDCKVDFKDLAIFAQSWLECNLEPKSACWE